MSNEERIKGLMSNQSPLFLQGSVGMDNSNRGVSTIWVYLLTNEVVGSYAYPMTGKIKPWLFSILVSEMRIADRLGLDVSNRFTEILIPVDTYNHTTDADIFYSLISNQKELKQLIKTDKFFPANERNVYVAYASYIGNLIEAMEKLKLIA